MSLWALEWGDENSSLVLGPLSASGTFRPETKVDFGASSVSSGVHCYDGASRTYYFVPDAFSQGPSVSLYAAQLARPSNGVKLLARIPSSTKSLHVQPGLKALVLLLREGGARLLGLDGLLGERVELPASVADGNIVCDAHARHLLSIGGETLVRLDFSLAPGNVVVSETPLTGPPFLGFLCAAWQGADGSYWVVEFGGAAPSKLFRVDNEGQRELFDKAVAVVAAACFVGAGDEFFWLQQRGIDQPASLLHYDIAAGSSSTVAVRSGSFLDLIATD